jgi:SNF2 family DNA or RNA helicase
MEMGTGKTKVIIDEFGLREDAKDCRNLLVIAPAGVYRNWSNIEIPKHMAPELLERTIILVWETGGGVGFKNRAEWFLRIQDRPRILVMNVEAFSVVQSAIGLASMFIGQRRTMVVIDESTKIKTPEAKRTASIINLSRKSYARRICSGLVAPRSPLDVFSQFNFLDQRILGFRSYFAFKARYAVTKNIGPPRNVIPGPGKKVRDRIITVGYRNEEELKDKIAPYSFRVLKDDCLDLPPKIYMEPRNVELTDQQRRILKELKTTAQAQLETGEYMSVKLKLEMLIRRHQVLCGKFVDEDGKEHEIPSLRLNALLEVLDEHSGKAIIWSWFRHSIKEIVKVLEKEYGAQSVVSFYGDTSASDRVEASSRFQNDPACRYIVANPQTGGMGNTWTEASLVVYYSNTWSLEDRLQSEDRAHRDGLTHPVTYVDLMCSEVPFEAKLIASLRKKLDLASIISGDGYREWVI